MNAGGMLVAAGAAATVDAPNVTASYARFRALTGDWAKVSEGGYYSLLP